MRRILLAILIALAGPSLLLAADPPEPAHLAPDELAIEKTIDELGDADFQTRKAATEKLEGYGPEVVPMLQKYREHDDPEIRARIARVMKSFGWMEKGAIISRINRGSVAERQGMRLGDVVVKVNDIDITGYRDIQKIPAKEVTTFYLWRAGKVFKAEVPPGARGFVISDWDVALGGNEHSRGLSVLNGKDVNYLEAYKRLRSARDKGMSDLHTIMILAGLAARAMDRAYADECLESISVHLKCGNTHWLSETMPLNVPVSSPLTARLLRRYATEPFTPQVSHELEDWFSKNGRNSPLLAEMLKKDQENDPQWMFYSYYHDMARNRLALLERRYELVARPGGEPDDKDDAQEPTYTLQSVIQMQAAIRSGNSAEAARLGLAMLDDKTLDREGPMHPEPALWGLACAAANGDQASVDQYFARIPKLTGPQAKVLGKLVSMESLNNPAAGAALLKYMEDRGPGPFASRTRQIALAALIADPASTRERFNLYISKYDPAKIDETFIFTMLTGALRFGDYERASGLVDILAKRFKDKYEPARTMSKNVIDFASKNADKLAGDWEDLRGAIQVVQHPDSKVIWAMRYDGQVLQVRPGEKPELLEGLPVPPSPVTCAYSHFVMRPDGKVLVLYPFGRDIPTNPGPIKRTLVYVLTPNSTRWLPLADFDKPLGRVLRLEVVHAIADKMVADGHPALPGDTQRQYVMMDQGYMWYEGDILVHVNPKTRQIRELSAEIGKLAGRDKPARVYKPEEHFDTRWVLFSDCGVWFFDTADGSLKRIELGLKDENVITCSLPREQFGKPGDNIYIGVAPQHGGQIFIFDPWTALPKATKGYNGFGPNDWYAYKSLKWHVDDPQEFIYTQYIARLAKQ